MTRDQYTHTVVSGPHQPGMDPTSPGYPTPTATAVHLQQRPPAPRYLSQVLAALAMSIGPFAAGMGKGYSSPAIASLQQRDSADFTVTGQQASWVASLSLLGALFGGITGGAAMRYGRRRLLLIVSAPLSASWMATVFAISVEVICITSFVGGFCVAIVQMVTQVYVSEISVPAIRGGLSALLKISGHIGVLVSFAAGAWLNWRQLAALVAAGPVALCVAVACVPETPSFLVLRGRDQEAERSLSWLRGGDRADVLFELATIKAGVRSCKERSAVQMTYSETCNRLLVELREPVLITCGLMFFQRFSGANAFNFYVVSVFRQTFGGMNPHGAAVAVALVQLLSTVLSGLLVDTAGRLPLLVASSVLMSLALAAFGSYAYYEDVHKHALGGQLDWVPLLCVLAFTVAFSLGISPISWLLVAELFPLEHRGLGTAMATSFSYLCAFVGVKTFVDFQDLFGLHGAFWLYAALSVCGLCFVVCLVPETKGQNLIEMDPKHLAATAVMTQATTVR